MKTAFRKLLLEWFSRARRDLPWRKTQDPYAIWLSEVMLQQTRVATVLPYYSRFLERFPTARDLAEAEEHDVLKLWSGLGYYSRARNLQKGARMIAGGFPDTYEAIRALPGVGDYTAAAIASIAHGLPYAAVDGNVLRVLARVSGDPGDIGRSATRERLSALASELIDRRRPGDFNQALMELGATVCTPRNPQCLLCPVVRLCHARKQGREQELPVKLRPVRPERVYRTLYVIERHGELLFWQRAAGSKRLAGFWELPEPEHVPGASEGQELGSFQHSIVNQRYQFRVVQARASTVDRQLRWLSPTGIECLFSTTTRKALRVAGVPGH
ncbi:MAG TPA: A/G-specific adenine glycosylase [Bryobacteraceae bacterium]|nr:A/G-specific adenine glycosylase [Bryobacteraceae bacterium]